jgi:Prealbumin-like fold domain
MLAAFVIPAFAVLGGGTTFEGSDGNLLVDTGGNTDWSSFVGTNGLPNGSGVPGSPLLHVGVDLTSGTGDNSFGQGTKEDAPGVTVVSGSIPPNKSDLTRFYEASDLINSQVYLYLAWERSNVLGSANMDFEINQNNPLTPTPCPDGKGSCTINRSNGDILVTYDFTNGGSRPTVAILRWLEVGGKNPYDSTKTNANADCFSANTLPCWGDQRTISTDNSEGAVNSKTVTDPIEPSAANPCPSGGCPAGTFGETAINLTGAGVITPANACNFGSATTFLKSRSSASFTSEVKDFISPVATPIVSTCGTITIIKHTDPRGLNQNFTFTPSSNLSSGTAFTLNDSGNSTSDTLCGTAPCNEKVFSDVAPGNYTVTEGSDPTGFALESLTCTPSTADSTGSSGTQDTTNGHEADITLGASGAVTCTFTNQQELGAILITKTGKDHNCASASTTITNGDCTGTATAALGGATFQVSTDSAGSNTITGSPFTTSNSTGAVCIDGLPWRDYYVKETGAPTGYSADSSTAVKASVTQNATCNSSNTAVATGTAATPTFTDTPLTKLTLSVASVLGGATNSSISCVDSSGSAIGNSPQPASGMGDNLTVHADGTNSTNPLPPGQYTCTVTIDP